MLVFFLGGGKVANRGKTWDEEQERKSELESGGEGCKTWKEQIGAFVDRVGGDRLVVCGMGNVEQSQPRPRLALMSFDPGIAENGLLIAEKS